MGGPKTPGSVHRIFTQWALDQGVVINGVSPAEFEGKRLGLVALRNLKAGEEIVIVPERALLNIDNQSFRDLGLPTKLSVHGRLAAFLTLNRWNATSQYNEWEKTWPSREEFVEALPIFWKLEAQDLLPPVVKELVNKKKLKLDNDKRELKPHLPTGSEELFEYFWFIIDTRCFYWDYPNTPSNLLPKKRDELIADDCLSLCPFADYFNHAAVGCKVSSNSDGYIFTTETDYEQGEEVFFPYGNHTNDFLLSEYGFVLEDNMWDTTTLDHVIIPRLAAKFIELLERDGYLGNYNVSMSQVNPRGHPEADFRTNAVIRLLALSTESYTAYITGLTDESKNQGLVDERLEQLMKDAYLRAKHMLATLQKAELKGQTWVKTLLLRWTQLHDLFERGVGFRHR